MDSLICKVCGMVINPKSYNLNQYSFIEKNTEGNIIYCPFCGVEKFYLNTNADIFSILKNTLDEQTTKILDMAMKLEVFNGEFYEEASKLAKSNKLSKVFKDLSKIEFMHAKIHKNFGDFKQMPKLRKPDYSRHNTDKALLEEAYRREEHAIAFYERYLDKVSSDIIKEVFIALSEVEKQHMDLTNENN